MPSKYSAAMHRVVLRGPLLMAGCATLAAMLLTLTFVLPRVAVGQKPNNRGSAKSFKVKKTDAEWRKQLTRDQYLVCRRKETEEPYTGEYWNSKEHGTYQCVCCGADLFKSETKFDSGTGWPSFWKALAGAVRERADRSHHQNRTEVLCDACGSHLGHVFADGPPPTHLRYCMNSVALKLKKSP